MRLMATMVAYPAAESSELWRRLGCEHCFQNVNQAGTCRSPAHSSPRPASYALEELALCTAFALFFLCVIGGIVLKSPQRSLHICRDDSGFMVDRLTVRG